MPARARCSTTSVQASRTFAAEATARSSGQQRSPGDARLGRPGIAGTAEQPALAEVDVRSAQRLELLDPLDALGHHAGADLAGERHGGAQHGLPGGVEVHAGDQPAAQLQEVGPDLGHVLERREARARVVDGDQRASRDPRAQPLLYPLDVLHGVLLGELDHQARGEPGSELLEARMAERLGRDVDEQQAPLRRRAGLADRGPARDLEVVAQAAARGGGERHVGRERNQPGRRGEAGEALVADRLQIAQADDGLKDRPYRARLEQPAEVVGPLSHSSGDRQRARLA